MQPTTADTMIRSWKKARLSSDSGNLGYPRINIIAKCALYGMGIGKVSTTIYYTDESAKDADMVQKIVFRMPQELRDVFEAKHLGLIKGKRCRNVAHKERARNLGISKSSYWRRVSSAHDFIKVWLDWEFDTYLEVSV